MRFLGAPQQSGPAVSLVEISGHSLTPGGGAFRISQGYAEKVALALGAKRRDNRGWGGAVSCWPTSGVTGDGGYPWVLQQLQRPGHERDIRPRRAPYLPSSQVVIHHNALNDLAVLGSQKPRPMQEAHRTIWSRYCAAAIWENADPQWAYTGTWTDNAQTTANSGPGIKYTTTVGDKATFTLPADYPGGLPVAVGIFLNAVHDLTVGVKVDGVARPDVRLNAEEICDKTQALKNMNVVLRFCTPTDDLDLGPGAHTIELTLKTQHVASSLLGIDYAQIEADPADGPVLVIPSNMRPLGYNVWNTWPHGPNHPTDPMNDAAIPVWDQALLDLFPEFGDRMVFADIDSALNKTPAYFISDNVHLTELGHAVVGEAVLKAILDSGQLTPRRLTRPDTSGQAWFDPVGQAGRTLFMNSWTSFNATSGLGFRRDLEGRVEVKGQVKSGSAANAVVFQLPRAFQPNRNRSFSAPTGANLAAWIVVNESFNASPGAVYAIAGGSTTNMPLDFSFGGGD